MDGYGKRLLIVDNDAGCRTLLADQLARAGYAVHTACDGVEGADEMRKRHFDAVITEGPCSEFSGLEFVGFCGIVWPDTPVILISGEPSYLTACADEFKTASCVQKPYSEATLLNVLRLVTQPNPGKPLMPPMIPMIPMRH